MANIKSTDITLDDFKSFFFRDFEYATPYGMTGPTGPTGLSSYSECPKDKVMDFDISKAFTEAKINFNDGLFGTDDLLKTAFLYISAHYLCNDLQTSSQGLGSSGYFPVSSRSVGSVSESYAIPEWMLKDPIFSFYSTTRYGQKYISMVKPLLIGNVQIQEGGTTYW